MRPENTIELDKCIHGNLYKLHSRNLRLGVYNSENQEFTGIRTKFQARFLDSEYHWDYRGPCATACPTEDLGKCPLDNISEFNNPELFEWLDIKLQLLENGNR